MIGTLLCNKGIVTPGHKGAVVRVLFLNRNLLHHGLDGSQLILTAKGHQNRTGTDGGVKPLRKPPLGAGIQVVGNPLHVIGERAGNNLASQSRLTRGNIHMLFSAVGV